MAYIDHRMGQGEELAYRGSDVNMFYRIAVERLKFAHQQGYFEGFPSISEKIIMDKEQGIPIHCHFSIKFNAMSSSEEPLKSVHVKSQVVADENYLIIFMKTRNSGNSQLPELWKIFPIFNPLYRNEDFRNYLDAWIVSPFLEPGYFTQTQVDEELYRRLSLVPHSNRGLARAMGSLSLASR